MPRFFMNGERETESLRPLDFIMLVCFAYNWNKQVIC